MSATKLIHKPIQPPRKTFIGECVYASMWEALMTTPADRGVYGLSDEPEPIEAVLGQLHVRIQQRHASVAASVVCWLGTNCGNAMLRDAERQRDQGHLRAYICYLMCWSVENRRAAGINNGIRTIEYLISPTDSYCPRDGLKTMPILKAQDLEVADHLMMWLAEHDGQEFIRGCESEIRRLMDEHSLAERAKWLRENFTEGAKT